MTFVDFEEKEFEGPTNVQLCLGGPMWSPGQVLEQVVGFDVAFQVQSSAVWALLGFSTPLSGAVIGSWWPHAVDPPAFHLNLFLQYKRPEFLNRSNALEWKFWKKAYFRFSITDHQQRALEACASGLGILGQVAYASPSFASRAELFKHIWGKTLLDNTHFAPVTKLAGHGRYTYVDALSPGVAHSEPERVAPLRFIHRQTQPNLDRADPEKLLAAAKQGAAAAIKSRPELVGSRSLYDDVVQRVLYSLRLRIVGSIRDFVSAYAFSRMSGIEWIVY